MKVTNLGISIRPQLSRDQAKFLANLVVWLFRRKIKIHFLENDQKNVTKILNDNQIKNISFQNETEFFGNHDLIISLGGDGTLIGTARKLRKNSPPIFSISLLFSLRLT